MDDTVAVATEAVDELAMDMAFRHSGRKGEQRTMDRGSGGKSKHQQYFTPKWVAECFPEIAKLFTQINQYANTNVLDPTAGVGRLLTVFQNAGKYNVLGIELDESQAAIAKRILGKENVRVGDILAYMSHLHNFDIAALNPPYDLHWQPPEGKTFELVAGSGLIESQKAVLEITTKALVNRGLMIGLFSKNFFDHNIDAKQYLYRNYRVVAMVDLPDAYKPEYGIEASSVLVVAMKNYGGMRSNYPEPRTGAVQDAEGLMTIMYAASRGLSSYDKLYPYGMMPNIPHLEMVVDIEAKPVLTVSSKGVQLSNPWTKGWAEFLDTTIPGYSQAEGSQSGLFEGIASLPNLLLGGIDPNLEQLKKLGFEVQCDENARTRLEGARKRFERERLPLRLNPVEMLAYYNEGWHTAVATVPVGKHIIQEGRRYHLTLRWKRLDKRVRSEHDEKEHSTTTTYVDMGFSVFELRPEGSEETIVLKETNVTEMEALIKALGVPKVKTAADLSDIAKWKAEMLKLQDKLAVRNGGKRLYNGQTEDVILLATHGQAGLYYEQGGGKTPVSAHWAMLRGYKRVLVVCPSFLAPNWMEELTSWGFQAVRLSHRTISDIRKEKRQKIQPKETTFYVCTYEQLKLSDPAYEPWDHDHFDREGNLVDTTVGITTGSCSKCKAEYEKVVTECPKCNAGSPDWNGARCTNCGFYGRYYQSDKSNYQWPFYKRIDGLFGAVILDESQVAKSKTTSVGMAVRSIATKGKLVLSGTPMKGYVTDLFWTTGWLLGYGSPLWPFPYQRGSSRFLHQFGTFQYVTKEFEDTLTTGKRKLIPAVSNLTRLWRLLSPTSIRRLKEDFLPDLPAKHRHMHYVPMDEMHKRVYNEVHQTAKEVLQRELRKDVPSMGAISRALWWMRYAASVPNRDGLSYFKDALGESGVVTAGLIGNNYAKVRKVVDLCKAAKTAGDKTIVFTSLRSFHSVLCNALKANGLRVLSITASTSTQNRVEKAWELKNGYDVLVASTNCLNRGVTITSANQVVITNLEWSPEATEQAEDRVHRPGQTKEVQIHYVLSEDTIDEDMMELINQKSLALKSILDRVARDTDVAALLEKTAEENFMVQLAKSVLNQDRSPRPAPAPIIIKPEEVEVHVVTKARNVKVTVTIEEVATFGQMTLF